MIETKSKRKRMGILGPLGTFTEAAALEYSKDAEIIPYDTITEVFEAVNKGGVKEGVVPIENILNGHVIETLDCLYKNGVKIKGALILPIKQNLVALPETEEIKKIVSHPQALAQCSDYIHSKYKTAKIEKTESTAAAMKTIAEEHLVGVAAIGTIFGAERYGLKVVAKNISNNKKNRTMFVVISKEEAPRTGNDRTSIVIKPHIDRPGLLRDILNSFAEKGINLEMIQSRPDGEGNYLFYIDLRGHPKDKNVREAFNLIKEKIKTKFGDIVKILGSYPYVSLAKK